MWIVLHKYYKTWIFDCDGVILDSNQVKSNAFYEVSLPYGQSCAEEFVEYHKIHGGVSRFEKIKFFYTKILKKTYNEEEVYSLIERYSVLCVEGLKSCSETVGLRKLLDSLSGINKFVVSGGLEQEIIEVFNFRGLGKYFDGIYGSPLTKKDILNRMDINHPCIFIGDSQYDYISSQTINADFMFMYGYTEFSNWQNFFADKKVTVIRDLEELSCDN